MFICLLLHYYSSYLTRRRAHFFLTLQDALELNLQAFKDAEDMAKAEREEHATQVQEEQQRHRRALAQAEACLEHQSLGHMRQRELSLLSIVSVVSARKNVNLTRNVLMVWLEWLERRRKIRKLLTVCFVRNLAHRLGTILRCWSVYRVRRRKCCCLAASALQRSRSLCLRAVLQTWSSYRIWRRKQAIMQGLAAHRTSGRCLRSVVRSWMSLRVWRRKRAITLRVFAKRKSAESLGALLSSWRWYFVVRRTHSLLLLRAWRSKARYAASQVLQSWRPWAAEKRRRRTCLLLQDSRLVSACFWKLAARVIIAWRCFETREKRKRRIVTRSIAMRSRIGLLRVFTAWSRHSGRNKQTRRNLALQETRLSLAVHHALKKRVVAIWRTIACFRAWRSAAAARECRARWCHVAKRTFSCWLALARCQFGVNSARIRLCAKAHGACGNEKKDALSGRESEAAGVSVSRDSNGCEADCLKAEYQQGSPLAATTTGVSVSHFIASGVVGTRQQSAKRKGESQENGHGVRSLKVASVVQSSWALIGAAEVGWKREGLLRLHHLMATVNTLNHKLLTNCLQMWVRRAQVATRSGLVQQRNCRRLLARITILWCSRALVLKGRRARAVALQERRGLRHAAHILGCWAHSLLIASLSSAEGVMDKILWRRRGKKVLISWREEAEGEAHTRAKLKYFASRLQYRRVAMAMTRFRDELRTHNKRNTILWRVQKLVYRHVKTLAFRYLDLWIQAGQYREACLRGVVADMSSKIERYAAEATANVRNAQLRALASWRQVHQELVSHRLRELKVAGTWGRMTCRQRHALKHFAFMTWFDVAEHLKGLQRKSRHAGVSLKLKCLTKGFCAWSILLMQQTGVRACVARVRHAMLNQTFLALVNAACEIQRQRRSAREEQVCCQRHERRRVLHLLVRVLDTWHSTVQVLGRQGFAVARVLSRTWTRELAGHLHQWCNQVLASKESRINANRLSKLEKRTVHARRRAQISRIVSHWRMRTQATVARRHATRRLLYSQRRLCANTSFLLWRSSTTSNRFASKRAQVSEARRSALASARSRNLMVEAVLAWRKDAEWCRRVQGDLRRVLISKRLQEVCVHVFLCVCEREREREKERERERARERASERESSNGFRRCAVLHA